MSREAGARIDAHVVTYPDEGVSHRAGSFDDPLLVGAPEDDDPGVVEDLLDRGHLAGGIEVAGVDDVHRLVEQHLLALLEFLDLDRRLNVHP